MSLLDPFVIQQLLILLEHGRLLLHGQLLHLGQLVVKDFLVSMQMLLFYRFGLWFVVFVQFFFLLFILVVSSLVSEQCLVKFILLYFFFIFLVFIHLFHDYEIFQVLCLSVTVSQFRAFDDGFGQDVVANFGIDFGSSVKAADLMIIDCAFQLRMIHCFGIYNALESLTVVPPMLILFIGIELKRRLDPVFLLALFLHPYLGRGTFYYSLGFFVWVESCWWFWACLWSSFFSFFFGFLLSGNFFFC